MSLIKKSNELVIPTTVKMMIYGQAGMGKSTVALSAPKPLLLDFDNGVKRMNMAHLENIDTVQVTSWSDVQQVLQEDLYNPQIQISVVSGTKRSIFRQKNKTKRSKKRLHTTLIKPEQKVNEDLCSGFIVS